MSDETATPQPPATPQEVVGNFSAAKDSIIQVAQAYPDSPGLSTVARQAVDHLDAAFLFYQSLIGLVNHMDQAVESKVASGDVVQFPQPGPGAEHGED